MPNDQQIDVKYENRRFNTKFGEILALVLHSNLLNLKEFKSCDKFIQSLILVQYGPSGSND